MNPTTPVILALIDLKENDIERFRNCSINENGIYIYTRTGGGNREDYPNEKLTAHPNYLRDEDDDYDSTYATYEFSLPEYLKVDIIKYLNIKENGIPASIISKCNEVWNRPENESDKFARIYDKQTEVYKNLRFNFGVYETNGHTIVPLSDDAMEKLLACAEENDIPDRIGEFMPYSIKPYKLNFSFETPSWQKNRLSRININLGDKWIIDQVQWGRYKSMFNEKYPKAISNIEKYIQ